MTRQDRSISLTLSTLAFPGDLQIPTTHFRLFLAANFKEISSAQLAGFADQALARGMVYVCAWGEDCERMHDCADEAAVLAEIEGRWSGHLMTTWHANESLEEAAIFFRDAARLSAEYAEADCCWIGLSLNDQSWTEVMRRVLTETTKN